MGLINDLLVGIIHLIFVAMDVLMMMIIVKIAYQRWKFEWFRSINNAVEPVINSIINYLDKWSIKITGKKYSEKTLLIFLILCLWLIRIGFFI
ncbi:MAG: hypothetical protein K8R02_07855 [Anaerohalosphaeraceae bacterium]|nr:hypothetical protein [Anaerohalosphaeraceae bacterium]